MTDMREVSVVLENAPVESVLAVFTCSQPASPLKDLKNNAKNFLDVEYAKLG
jgi:hypothetical protein